jgi:hypothetical protein
MDTICAGVEAMNKKYGLLIFLILFPSIGLAGEAADGKKFKIEVESGAVWQSRNDVRIPNSTGTNFSLRDVQGSGPFVFGRFSFDWSLNPKHEIAFLIAPLSITSTGELQNSILFDGKSFNAGSGIKATYKFNSYRMTYRYRIYNGDRWIWKIGITGKIREAKIGLIDRTISAEYTDLGFVPLINLDGEYRCKPKWKFHLNMDGLAAPQGRAFDISFKTEYDLSNNWTVGAGYRMLEGGADVDKVYAFAWLHYATASIALRF